jgi:hypothetical protein
LLTRDRYLQPTKGLFVGALIPKSSLRHDCEFIGVIIWPPDAAEVALQIATSLRFAVLNAAAEM